MPDPDAPSPADAPAEAARHASARSARASALTEDYVEIIADLLELVEKIEQGVDIDILELGRILNGYGGNLG